MRFSQALIFPLIFFSASFSRIDPLKKEIYKVTREIERYSEKPVAYSDKLRVNTENEFVFYLGKSESEGIEDLFEVIESAKSEECYLHADGNWIEVGYDEFSTTDWFGLLESVEVDEKMVSRFIKQHPRLTLWHIHREKAGLETRASKPRIAMPSSRDLKSLIYFNKKCLAENPYSHLTQGVVSRYGVARYSLTQNGRGIILNNLYSLCDENKKILDQAIAIVKDERQCGLAECLNDLDFSDPNLEEEFEAIISHGLIKIDFTPRKLEE